MQCQLKHKELVQKGDHLNLKSWCYLFSVRRVYEAGESLHGDSFIAGGRPLMPPLLRQISVPSVKSTKRQNGMYNKFLVSCFKRYLGKIRKCMNVSAGCFGQFPKLLKNLPVLHPVCSIISLTSDEAAFFTEEEGTFYPGKCYSCKGCFLITVSLKKKEE